MTEEQEQYREGEQYGGETSEPNAPFAEGIPAEGMGYDSEWVRFLDALGRDSSMAHIVDYLRKVDLTDKARNKLIVYTHILLDKEFAVSRIRDQMDLTRLMDDKNLVDADINLGLTVFDLSPEFQHVLNLLRIKFDIKIRRSVGGFERKMISTQRSEAYSEERIRPQADTERSIREKGRALFK